MATHQYKIPCKHETGEVRDTEIQVNDHHPLLSIALQCTDFQVVASIQCRLGQGIPGMVCPQDTEGPVARANALMDEAFVAGRRAQEPLDSLTDSIFALMGGK